MALPASAAINGIRLLDELLLDAVAGQEKQVADWIAQREQAVRRALAEEPSLADLAELQDRTRRLEDRYLHWRRTSIMELSLIDQHLRYLHAQQPDSVSPVPARINVSA